MKKLLLLVMIMLSLALFGCNKATVFVKFVPNSGLAFKAYDRDYDSPPDSTGYWWGGYNFSQGDLLPTPDNVPSRSGYQFTAWYQEEACIIAWDFQHDVVNQNLRLYAGWENLIGD